MHRVCNTVHITRYLHLIMITLLPFQMLLLLSVLIGFILFAAVGTAGWKSVLLLSNASMSAVLVTVH